MSAKRKNNLQIDTKFCPKCDSILSKPDLNDNLSCNICQFFSPHKNLLPSTSAATSPTEIITEEFYDCGESVQKAEKSRPQVKLHCSKCPAKSAYYLAIQMRSVDEGQTIFYECVECGHKTRVDS